MPQFFTNMKRTLWVLGAMAALPLAEACCISYGDVAMTLANERAVIIWDQKAKIQHFIRSANFEGKAEDFGFILPTPTQPTEIAVAQDEVFGVLASAKPRDPSEATGGVTRSADGSVQVLDQRNVGDFEVTVLKAQEGKAIGEWLTKNKHKMRPAMEPWLDHYAERGWILTAFKYKGRRSNEPTKAVRVTFAADYPHYPFKMPTDTWSSENHHRKLDLFLVSQTPMKGAYTNGRAWETPASWSNELSPTDTARLNRLGGEENKPLTVPEGMVVTHFKNVPEATDYDHDLTFDPNNPPFWALWLGLGAFASAGYAFWRRSKLPPEER